MTLVVALIAFVGGLLVEGVRRRATDRRWLLDRRHDAYADFLTCDEEFRRAYSAAETAIQRGEQEVDSFPSLEAAGRLARARFALLIFGSDGAQWLAGQVEDAAIAMVEKLGQLTHDPSAADAEAREMAKWEGELAEQLRAEFQPLRRRWKRPWAKPDRRLAKATPLDEPRPAL